MRNPISYLTTLVLAAFCVACGSSGKKALDRGNYEESVMQSVDKLRRSPDNRSATEVLQQAYPKAEAYLLENIRQAEASTDPFKWDVAARSYMSLNKMADEIRRCPSCSQLFPNPKRYQTEEESARNLAASAHYEAGLDAMQNKQDRMVARQAYDHFSATKDMVSTYRDVDRLLDESFFYASLKVVMEPAQVNSRLYQLSNEYFQGKINEYLATNRRMNKFVRFYTPEEARSSNLKNPDQIVRLEFVDFVVGQTLITSNTETLTSKDSVVVGQTTVNGKKVDVFNRVNAKYTLNRKSVKSTGLLNMQIIDVRSNKILTQEQFPGEYIWNNEWGNFNGDERALNSDQKRICQTKEQIPPPPQQLFIEFCKPIYDRLTTRVRKFYEAY
ncbi:MAG: hypothetical protein U0Y10_15250 [Spirosomataceae bacterium]